MPTSSTPAAITRRCWTIRPTAHTFWMSTGFASSSALRAAWWRGIRFDVLVCPAGGGVGRHLAGHPRSRAAGLRRPPPWQPTDRGGTGHPAYPHCLCAFPTPGLAADGRRSRRLPLARLVRREQHRPARSSPLRAQPGAGTGRCDVPVVSGGPVPLSQRRTPFAPEGSGPPPRSSCARPPASSAGRADPRRVRTRGGSAPSTATAGLGGHRPLRGIRLRPSALVRFPPSIASC